jgi:endoglucanase
MKVLLIRFQILLIVLVVFSPLLYLGYKRFTPEIELFKYDLSQKNLTYPIVSPLHTEGTQVLDNSNRPVILRGVNLISTNWNPIYLDWNPQAVEKAASDWKANVIRSRIYQYEFEANPAAFFLKMEQQIFEPARKHGLYIIVHPWFGENQSLPKNEGVKMWLAFAKRYGNDPHFIFDLFAEPRDIPFEDLKSSYEALIPQIRQIAPNSLIMVTGLDWGRDINAWYDQPLPYDNLIYRANPYNKTGEFESFIGKIALKRPIFLGEFGTQDKLSMTLTDVKNLLGYADQLNVGWTAWHFTATGCPCLLEGESSFTPTPYGSVVKSALAGQKHDYQLPTFDLDPSKLYVYSDFLESGFADYSWGITNKLGQSISTNFHKSSGLFLNTSRRLSPSNYQTFNLTFQSDRPENFSLRFKSWDNQLSNSISLTNGINSIPISSINLNSVSGLIIEAVPDTPDPTPITLDQIYFQK